MIPAWVERYIGIPFVTEGASFKGAHCWGLVRLVFMTERGITLPAYGEISAQDLLAAARAVRSDSAGDPWSPVAGDRQPFDVLLMRCRPAGGGMLIAHCGIMVTPAHVLHVEEATASVCVPVGHPSVRARAAGAFRHRGLS